MVEGPEAPQRAAAPVRVLLWHRVAPTGAASVEDAYHRVSRHLSGTPGLLANELLRSTLEPGSFVVMSSWETLDAFRDWESGPAHRHTTAPLRPYQDAARDRAYDVLERVAAYPA
jgi:heme oxygenase (mycobilin-producing)